MKGDVDFALFAVFNHQIIWMPRLPFETEKQLNSWDPDPDPVIH
jgi:hypothetical protein